MSINEFAIIEKYFNKSTKHDNNLILGIGDDAAITTIPRHHELVITTDTLVAEVHFKKNDSAFNIGYKSLAVNLSDLAAMGSTPKWATLSLTLPKANKIWLKNFAKGFFTLAKRYRTELIGGDLTRGPLSISISAFGIIPKKLALRRDNAHVGDLIFVSNTIGDAGYALKYKKHTVKLHRPEPQILLGEKLRGLATSAIDISDGLAQDLIHILEKSHVGAVVNVDAIPLSKKVRTLQNGIQLALTAGDDYQLCFTVPKKNINKLKKLLTNFSFTCIGVITKSTGLILINNQGKKYVLKKQGYQHF